jgi:hypothetical protein
MALTVIKFAFPSLHFRTPRQNQVAENSSFLRSPAFSPVLSFKPLLHVASDAQPLHEIADNAYQAINFLLRHVNRDIDRLQITDYYSERKKRGKRLSVELSVDC